MTDCIIYFLPTEPEKLTNFSDAHWTLMKDAGGSLVSAARLNNNQTWRKVCIPLSVEDREDYYKRLLNQVQIQHTTTYTSSEIWLARELDEDDPNYGIDLFLETVVEGDCNMFNRKPLNLLQCKYKYEYYSMVIHHKI